MLKRLVDIMVALVVVAMLGVPMLIIAALIRLESPGGAIFCQRRAGWRSKPFTMLKFRTMRSNVDAYGHSPHSADDPRLTRVGKFLRETSLDELPQLFNVLAGQMSLVGPRPLYERQAAQWNARQRRRLDVHPGITGYAQAYGRVTLTHEEKIEFDIYYVENRSFLLDLKIAIKTLTSIFAGSGETYEQRYSVEKERETDC